MKNIKERVIAILEELGSGRVKRVTQTLKDDLGINSLHTVVMIVAMEEEFGIEFSDDDLNPALFVTVESVIQLVEKYVNK